MRQTIIVYAVSKPYVRLDHSFKHKPMVRIMTALRFRFMPVLAFALLTWCTAIPGYAQSKHALAVGDWDYVLDAGGQIYTGTLKLAEQADSLVGTITAESEGEGPLKNLALKDSTLSFDLDHPTHGLFNVILTLHEKDFNGVWKSQYGDFGITGKRKTAGGPVELVGAWDYTIETSQGTFPGVLEFAETDGNLGGKVITDMFQMTISNVKIDGPNVTFDATNSDFGTSNVVMTIEGSDMKGMWKAPNFGDMPIKGKKK